jgi:hypothetical protein
MWGKDTLTTLVSIISMKVGNITVRAMIHLFDVNLGPPDRIRAGRKLEGYNL